MQRLRVLTVILAGGAGKRLGGLTEGRAKPAVSFLGTYRLIDFPLSNCAHSGLSDVWVMQQFNPTSVADHVSNGRPWDLDRTRGGLVTLHPRLGEGGGWHRGTADALWRNASLVREFGPDVLLVLSADAVYRLDYRDVIDAHEGAGADVTMVTTEVAEQDASRYGVVQLGDSSRIKDYAYKPDEPAGRTVATEVFAFRPDPLLDVLDELGRDVDPEEGLDDLGDALLPRLVQDGQALGFPLDGYWRDVGTVESYWRAHLDFLADEPPIRLGDPDWPVLTRDVQRPPARIRPSGSVTESLLGPACDVRGRVHRSVLAPGVVVAADADVTEAVLLHDVHVDAGAVVTRAVLDDGVTVASDARVGRPGRDGDVTLVGRGRRIDAKAAVTGDEAADPA